MWGSNLAGGVASATAASFDCVHCFKLSINQSCLCVSMVVVAGAVLGLACLSLPEQWWWWWWLEPAGEPTLNCHLIIGTLTVPVM